MAISFRKSSGEESGSGGDIAPAATGRNGHISDSSIAGVDEKGGAAPLPDTTGSALRPGSRGSGSHGLGETTDTQLQRGLSGRHLNFIAIGGAIGTGFFIGSGAALAKAGPVGCLIAFVFVGTILWTVMVSLSEMATYLPTAGAFSAYATRFVDPSLGFALGWLYWFSCRSSRFLFLELVRGSGKRGELLTDRRGQGPSPSPYR